MRSRISSPIFPARDYSFSSVDLALPTGPSISATPSLPPAAGDDVDDLFGDLFDATPTVSPAKPSPPTSIPLPIVPPPDYSSRRSGLALSTSDPSNFTTQFVDTTPTPTTINPAATSQTIQPLNGRRIRKLVHPSSEPSVGEAKTPTQQGGGKRKAEEVDENERAEKRAREAGPDPGTAMPVEQDDAAAAQAQKAPQPSEKAKGKRKTSSSASPSSEAAPVQPLPGPAPKAPKPRKAKTSAVTSSCVSGAPHPPIIAPLEQDTVAAPEVQVILLPSDKASGKRKARSSDVPSSEVSGSMGPPVSIPPPRGYSKTKATSRGAGASRKKKVPAEANTANAPISKPSNSLIPTPGLSIARGVAQGTPSTTFTHKFRVASKFPPHASLAVVLLNIPNVRTMSAKVVFGWTLHRWVVTSAATGHPLPGILSVTDSNAPEPNAHYTVVVPGAVTRLKPTGLRAPQVDFEKNPDVRATLDEMKAAIAFGLLAPAHPPAVSQQAAEGASIPAIPNTSWADGCQNVQSATQSIAPGQQVVADADIPSTSSVSWTPVYQNGDGYHGLLVQDVSAAGVGVQGAVARQSQAWNSQDDGGGACADGQGWNQQQQDHYQQNYYQSQEPAQAYGYPAQPNPDAYVDPLPFSGDDQTSSQLVPDLVYMGPTTNNVAYGQQLSYSDHQVSADQGWYQQPDNGQHSLGPQVAPQMNQSFVPNTPQWQPDLPWPAPAQPAVAAQAPADQNWAYQQPTVAFAQANFAPTPQVTQQPETVWGGNHQSMADYQLGVPVATQDGSNVQSSFNAAALESTFSSAQVPASTSGGRYTSELEGAVPVKDTQLLSGYQHLVGAVALGSDFTLDSQLPPDNLQVAWAHDVFGDFQEFSFPAEQLELVLGNQQVSEFQEGCSADHDQSQVVDNSPPANSLSVGELVEMWNAGLLNAHSTKDLPGPEAIDPSFLM